MKTWQIAFRNIFRSRRRTLITVFAMAFALAIMVMYVSLMDGLLHDMKTNALLMNMGHIQIHHKGYRESPSIYERIEHPDELVKKIEAKGYHASERLFAFGLAAHDNSSAGAQLRGVDAKRESLTTRLPHHLDKGKWLSADAPMGVVLGKRLAATLGVGIGDEIVLVVQAADGSMGNDLYTVRGILKSVGEAIDRSAVFMPMATFRELMVLDTGAHEIVVTLPEETTPDAARDAVAAIAGDNLETATWKELNPTLFQLLQTSETMMFPMVVIVYIAIAIVVLNAMLMAVFERIKEYGVMKALGVGPWLVFRLVMSETLIMASAAVLSGLLVGIPATLVLETHGIDLSAWVEGASMSGVALDPIWRSILSLEAVLMPTLTLYLLAALATIYPAVKAARLNPIDAIQHH